MLKHVDGKDNMYATDIKQERSSKQEDSQFFPWRMLLVHCWPVGQEKHPQFC